MEQFTRKKILHFMQNEIYTVEFITGSNDYHIIAFQYEPTQVDIDEYIKKTDWLFEEKNEDTLEHIITKIEFIDNTIKEMKTKDVIK